MDLSSCFFEYDTLEDFSQPVVQVRCSRCSQLKYVERLALELRSAVNFALFIERSRHLNDFAFA